MKKLFIATSALLFVMLFLIASSTTFLTGCTQNNSDTGVSSTNTVAEIGDTVTLNDNSTTYTNINSGLTLTQSTNNSIVLVQVGLVVAFPVAMSFSATGPAKGIGTYRSAPVDSTATVVPFYFNEAFPGGEGYKVDSTLVNITKISGDTVAGTYQLWLSNTSKTETVTGSISCDYSTVIN